VKFLILYLVSINSIRFI